MLLLATSTSVNNCYILLFIHHIRGETVLFIIQTSDRMQYFTIFQDELHSVNIQDYQPWAFSETVEKMSKITYTASRFSRLTSAKFAVYINRVTLQYNMEFIMFFFFLCNGFITMCNLKKRLIRAAFWVLLQAMFVNEWKQTARTAITIARDSTNNQSNKYNSVKHLQRQQLSFTKTSIKVFLKILSLKAYVYVLSRPSGVCVLQRWTRGKKIAKSFLCTAKFITKYSSERFLSRKYI